MNLRLIKIMTLVVLLISLSMTMHSNVVHANEEDVEINGEVFEVDVVRLKEEITELGFGGMNINSTYGNFTAQRVGEFQTYYGLPKTGKPDEATINMLRNIMDSPFHVGEEDASVILIKEMLIELGYGGMNLNETYGGWTATRVSQFQKDNGLKVNGVIDPPTHSLLHQMYEEQSNDIDIVEFKEALTTLGFGGMNINSNFGSFTAQRTGEFQKYYGLPVTNKADEKTVNFIDNIMNSPLQLGRSHEDVIQLKEMLVALGYNGININETYGSWTETRVSQFQRDNGLNDHGIADPRTLTLLKDRYEEETRDDAEIILLKESLTSLGFGGMNINTTYGSFTASRVGQFQDYYGLPVTEEPDVATMNLIDEIMNSPYHVGRSHEDVISLKEKLSALGYNGMNINESYGSWTATRVSQFQDDFGLKSHGIADPRTRSLLKTVYEEHQENERELVIWLKESLTDLNFGGMNINATYGSFTEQRVGEFQEYYGLPVTKEPDDETVDFLSGIMDSPFHIGRSHSDVIPIKEQLVKLGYGGMNINGTYGSFTASRVADFQKDHGLKVNGIVDPVTKMVLDLMANATGDYGVTTASSLNMRSGPGTSNHIVGSIPRGTIVSIENKSSNGWYKVRYNNQVGYVSPVFFIEYTDGGPDFADDRKIGYVNTNGLNVRRTASTSLSPIDRLEQNTRVEIIDTISSSRANSWYKIRYDGGSTGYVAAGFVQLASKVNVNSGPLNGKTIILDPGHGAHDSGGIGGGMLEKDVVLDIGLRAEQILRDAGAEVIMTRRDDTFLSLSQRSQIANNSNADLFVSIHTNMFNGSANGTETFWHGKYARSDSRRLAELLQKHTVDNLDTHHRRVVEYSLHVIRETMIPSALLEVAFKDYPEDAAKLRQDGYRHLSAEAIRDAIIEYYK